MQRGSVEVDLIPPEVNKLAHPQAVAVGDEDHGGVAVAPAVALGGSDQGLDLLRCQVLPRSQVAVLGPLRCDCSVFGGWRHQPQVPLAMVSAQAR